jgi:hypothetical protein
MKTSPLHTLGLAALVLGAGCGPAPVPERGPVAPLAIGPAAPPRPAPPARVEAPPRAPDDLELLVRVSDPEQFARTVVAMLPSSAAAAALEPGQLVMMLLGRRLGALVDLAQPIDITSNTGSSFVVSMAVKQDAETRFGEGLVLRDEGGLLRIGKPDDAPMDGGRLDTCAFSSAAGRATMRLLCASDEAALKGSGPYLARNVAGEPLDTDLRLTLPGRVLRDKRDATARAIGDAASARLGADLVERFLGEIDHLDMNARFAGGGIEMGLDVRLSARQSMVAQVLVSRTAAAPPPRTFYRLPADALFAMHTRGALAEDIAPLRKAIVENLEGTMLQDGYRSDKTHELLQRMEALFLTGGPIVVGAGVAGGRDGADKALAAFDSAAASEQARAETKTRAALLPWVMIAVDEPGERWTTGLREVVRRAEEIEKSRRPGSKSSTPRDPDGDHLDMRIGALDPALKLPKDTLHVEVLIAPRTKGKRPTRTAHLFVMPKASGTWVGYCEDAAAIATRLRLAADDATEAGTLSRSEEAASLRTRPALAAGLVSPAGIGHLFATTTTADDLRRAAKRSARTTGLGARGSQSLTWTATADPTPGSVRFSVGTDMTRQTATDLLRMLGM